MYHPFLRVRISVLIANTGSSILYRMINQRQDEEAFLLLRRIWSEIHSGNRINNIKRLMVKVLDLVFTLCL